MARHEGPEAATPVVMGEQLDPPKYGELWSEAASRVFFAPYREYEQRVKFANAEGVLRRQLMCVSQLIPVYVQRCFARHYYQRQVLTAEELLNALRQHAGYSTAVGQTMLLRTSPWSVWSRGGQTCLWIRWRREVPGKERLRISFIRRVA